MAFGLFGMNKSIDFDAKLKAGAAEVEDEGADRVLAAKMPAEAIATEEKPQRPLGLRHAATQGLCAIANEVW